MRAFVAVFLPLLVAYAVTLGWVVDRWNAPTQYFAHGWLVPPIAAFVVWRARARWRAVPASVDRRGLWLLLPALLLHAAGALLMVDSWSAASLVLAVPGAAWFALGSARLRGLWPVLWFTAFAVPLPLYVEGRLAFTLKEIAVQGGLELANLCGAAMVRQGDLLVPQGGRDGLFVADACGGLRSLLAMLTLAYCLVFFLGGAAWRRRLVMLAAAPLLAIAANTLRIAVLCLLARHVDVGFAQGTGHDWANAGEWVVLIGALLALDALTSRGAKVATAPVAVVLAPTSTLRPGFWLWVVAPLLIGLSLYRPTAAGTARAEALPAQLGAFTLVPRTTEQETAFRQALPRWCELLGTADFVVRTYRAPDQPPVYTVALFHDANWKSVHPPRICIEGSGMTIEIDDRMPAPWLGAEAEVGRIVARHRGDGARYLTLLLYGTRDWSAADYGAYTWHHMPRALLRDNESGFLVRAETYVANGEALDAAAARCAAFLRELVPAARGMLR